MPEECGIVSSILTLMEEGFLINCSVLVAFGVAFRLEFREQHKPFNYLPYNKFRLNGRW